MIMIGILHDRCTGSKTHSEWDGKEPPAKQNDRETDTRYQANPSVDNELGRASVPFLADHVLLITAAHKDFSLDSIMAFTQYWPSKLADTD